VNTSVQNAITIKDINTILVQNNEVNTMATDPVCLMIVDEEDAKFMSTHKSLNYYFCCNWCKKQFDENPKRYSRISNDVSVNLKETR
jgi:YHS domain-containing protein